MLLLIFYVGEYCYAISGKRVVEVLSLVNLNKLAQTPQYVAGLLNYRDKIIPVIDLCKLLTGDYYNSHLSTRIIVVSYASDDEITYLLGVIAERLTETLNIQETDFVSLGVQANVTPYLGKIILKGQDMIQYIQVECLLSEADRKSILIKSE